MKKLVYIVSVLVYLVHEVAAKAARLTTVIKTTTIYDCPVFR